MHAHERERVQHLGDRHLVVLDELVLESLSIDEGVVASEVQDLVRVFEAGFVPFEVLVELGDCALLDREELLLERDLPWLHLVGFQIVRCKVVIPRGN